MHKYETPALRSIFASLVRKAGGGPSVVVAVEQLTGRKMSEGTLSKISKGEGRFDWELAFQLEDMLGQFPIRTYLNTLQNGAAEKSDFQILAEAALKEIGEVPAAVLHGVATGDFGPLEKEGPEGLSALQNLMSALQRMNGQDATKEGGQ